MCRVHNFSFFSAMLDRAVGHSLPPDEMVVRSVIYILSTGAAIPLRPSTTATVNMVNNPFVRCTSYTFTVTDNSGKVLSVILAVALRLWSTRVHGSKQHWNWSLPIGSQHKYHYYHCGPHYFCSWHWWFAL